MINRNITITLDMFCFLFLIACVWIGPLWVMRVAITIIIMWIMLYISKSR